MSRFFKSAAFPILLVILLAFFVQNLFFGGGGNEDLTFNDFQTYVAAGQVKDVTVKTKDYIVQGTLTTTNKKFEIGWTDPFPMFQYLVDHNVKFNTDIQKSSFWGSLLTTVLPILLMVVFFIFLMNQMQGGGSKVMSFGKSRAKRMAVDQPKITFKDVAGVDEAVEELEEIKDFLENPKRFQALGARIPKGVLLFGPPGTGKTLLARAVAGEAGVPFFSISGSDFVEMFVGVGASRVRDLFEQAKQNQPCIIFIDEIDAVGRHRGAGMGGGHDEREQTLNQLLVEMDGFEANESIIIMAATNRPDILDPALLRPGRFDRQIIVDRPDREGRKAILAVHAKGKPLAPGVVLDTLAAQTPGFTGADLANLVNEAALLTARKRKRVIDMEELEEVGPQGHRRSGEEVAPALRRGEAHHRLSRDRARPCGPLPAQRRPGAQDLHHQPRAGSWLHHHPSDRRQVHGQEEGDPRQALAHACRPRGGGDPLRRHHHRGVQRPAAGHRDGAPDDHPVRHEREPRVR